MNTNEFDFKILKLTDEFYNAYPTTQYEEILKKPERPYTCMILKASDDYFICIPYRTEIRHPYAYHFKNSIRAIQYKSGLDYSKMVIIKNTKYLDSTPAIVDNHEYIETVNNINRIRYEAFDFLQKYIHHVKGESILHLSEFRRRYRYSPLKYFHNELGI